MSADGAMQQISYSHVAIGTTNMARALPFYQALGFRVTLDRIERNAALDAAMSASGATEDRHVVYMRSNDGNPIQFLSLHHRPSKNNKPLKAEDVGIDHFSIWVRDMDTIIRAAVAAGGKVTIPPFVADGEGWTLPKVWIRSTFLADPDGTLVQLDEIVTEPNANEIVT